ncbi:unnamed protein product [Penicillium viridicatum]
MIYQRGTNASYQRSADLVCDESYRFDRMLPYFERSTCSTPPNEELSFTNSSPLYDASVMDDCQGPLSISYSNYAFSFAPWAAKGLRALEIQPIDGFLGGSLLGQSLQLSAHEGVMALGLRVAQPGEENDKCQDGYQARHQRLAML